MTIWKLNYVKVRISYWLSPKSCIFIAAFSSTLIRYLSFPFPSQSFIQSSTLKFKCQKFCCTLHRRAASFQLSVISRLALMRKSESWLAGWLRCHDRQYLAFLIASPNWIKFVASFAAWGVGIFLTNFAEKHFWPWMACHNNSGASAMKTIPWKRVD